MEYEGMDMEVQVLWNKKTCLKSAPEMSMKLEVEQSALDSESTTRAIRMTKGLLQHYRFNT